jgi:hypothetical protein
VLRHISGSNPCFAADLGFKEKHVEARAGDVMAGAGGAAGPAPDVRHQPPGKEQIYTQTLCSLASALLAKGLRWLDSMREIMGLIPDVADFLHS